MRVEFGDRARVQALVVRRQAHDGRRWRACDDLLQPPFLRFQIFHPRRQCAWRVLVLLDPGDELGDAGAGRRQVMLGLRALGASGLRPGCELLLKESGEALDEGRGQQALTRRPGSAGKESWRWTSGKCCSP